MRTAFLTLFPLLAVAVSAHSPAVPFVENRGQWPAQVLYRAMVPGGAVFVERDRLTIVQYAGIDLHRHGRVGAEVSAARARGHAYRVHFEGGLAQDHLGGHRSPHVENHFKGNDPARWGTDCAVYGQVTLKEVWPGIDVHLDGRAGFKYEMHLAPGADPALVRMRYEGPDGLALKGRELHVALSTGVVVEEAPVVFHPAPDGGRRPVRAAYQLHGDRLSFRLPDGHDRTLPLTIDPVLTFASFSGSTADNFGFTATYDLQGHLYGGGIVFDAGYPTAMGGFDPTWNGGTIDVGVSKWTPDGSALVWSTYLGGGGNEAPHSLVCNADGELFIMGSVGSGDFPVTPGCFDPIFNGGPNFNIGGGGYGFGYPLGVDVFVAHLSAAGNALIGSTYVGTSGSDGVNTSVLYYNYGDPFRGEIAIDANGNPVVATCTDGFGMPVTPGAVQGNYAGGVLDGYVFRMNPALSTMLWATYWGGNGADAAYGVQFATNGEVYITGGTTSTNLGMPAGAYQGANAGGVDGFIARFSPTGSVLLSATYLGTNDYDQCYFVQVDTDDDVYVVGQTKGNYPVSPGVYANPGSSQFIHKLNASLSSSIWSTRIGNGSITQDLSPSAFLVADCGQIYFSGWAGSTNNIAQPTASTSMGSPVTPDAFQSTTDGSDFYLMVLEADAAGLNYATFFGGISAEHVDGGTSRFDKSGKVYQAVCAGCGGNSGFPTTPGSWSNTNNSWNCNLGVFKFDLSQPLAIIGIQGPGTVCSPQTVQFTNNSIGGDTYLWDFGDGSTSTDFAPQHTFTGPGTFTVTMVLSDSQGCTDPDTASIQVISLPPPTAQIDPVPVVCPGGSVQLQASGGTAFAWFPPDGLSSTSVPDPIATPPGDITYFVVVTDQCGSDTASVDITVSVPQGTVMPGVELCLGGSVTLSAAGGATYAWSPASTLSNPSIANPVATPTETTTYTVTITNADGCEVTDSVTVTVVDGLPTPVLEDLTICLGASAQLTAPAASSHLWQAANGLGTLDQQTVTVTPTTTTLYVVTATNVCGSIQDSALVTVAYVVADAWPDTIVCPGNPVQLFASGGTSYQWTPAAGLSDPTVADPVATVNSATNYTVTVTDANGCSGTASLSIGMLPQPSVAVFPDRVIIDPWGQALLHAITTADSLLWSPPDGVDCTTCAMTWAQPGQSTVYTVTVTAGNGCTATATVAVIITGTLFVPNTFTPDGDGVNDFFFALGTELAEFRMIVFNRWGEEIFRTEDLHGRWDGTYKGVQSPIDTYVWRIDAVELAGKRHTRYGHVNLVR